MPKKIPVDVVKLQGKIGGYICGEKIRRM